MKYVLSLINLLLIFIFSIINFNTNKIEDVFISLRTINLEKITATIYEGEVKVIFDKEKINFFVDDNLKSRMISQYKISITEDSNCLVITIKLTLASKSKTFCLVDKKGGLIYE